VILKRFVSQIQLYLFHVCLAVIYLLLGYWTCISVAGLHRLHYSESNGWTGCRAGQVGVHHFAGSYLSRTRGRLPGAVI